MKGFIAADGGGSKTELVLCNEAGNIFSREIISCTNPNDIGVELTCQRLEATIKKLIEKAKEIDLKLECILLAIAGVEFGNLADVIKEKLQASLSFSKIIVEGDLASVRELTLANKDNGVVIISGTGFNMSFKNDGEFSNVGGWGYIPDNYLSGFDLGKDALIACSKAIDGVGKNTCLVKILENHFGNRLWYAMDEIYKSGVKGVASLSKYVVEGYLNNDEVCKKIIDNRVKNLADVIKAKTNNKPVDIFLCGGIFENNKCIVEKLGSCLENKYSLEISKKRTIYGAVALAKNHLGKSDDCFYNIFDKEYKEMSQ